MASLPEVTLSDIKLRVGEQSFARGEKYHRDRAVFDTKRVGMTLKARCRGSRDNAYRVTITLDQKKRVADAECSCPVGDGGFCKHVAAVLLAWRARPSAFVEAEDVDKALDRRSKPELIALVKQMLRRQPDLEILLETPLPAAGGRKGPVSPETYRRQAEAAFQNHDGYEWGGSYDIAEEIQPLIEIGDGFLAQNDSAAASAVFEGVLAAAAENFESVNDEEGDVGDVMRSCVEGLGRCLPGLTDEKRRSAVLRALFDAFDSGIDEYGGMDEGVGELLAKHAQGDERLAVAGWVREAIAEHSGQYEDYHRRSLGGLLIDLEGDTLDDEAFLKACREAGLHEDLIDRLLDRGRVDEALREAGGVTEYTLLGMEGLFKGRKKADAFERLVLDRAGKTKDVRIWEWLAARSQAKKDWPAARGWSERVFRDRPTLEGYKGLRTLSKQVGDWDEYRPKLLAPFDAKRDGSLLTRIALDEGDIDRALELVKPSNPKARASYGWAESYGNPEELEVARAAEASRPRAAAEIYRRRAEALIDLRGRENYQTACGLLKKVRALHERLGETFTWSEYLESLREKHSTLRALQEELKKAKLVG